MQEIQIHHKLWVYVNKTITNKLFYIRKKKRPMMHLHEPRPGKDKDLELKPTRNSVSLRQSGKDLNSVWH